MPQGFEVPAVCRPYEPEPEPQPGPEPEPGEPDEPEDDFPWVI